MTNKRILTLISVLLFSFVMIGCIPIIINQPPVITSDPVETATVGVTYTYNVVATDPNAGDVLNYSLTTEPEGMLIGEDSGVITWKADDITTAGVGDYDVVVVVKDEKGLSDSQDFTITVGEFVVELIRIEVNPGTMILPEKMSETFEVIAYYNDNTDSPIDFADCDYGLSKVGIVIVGDTGLVTAEAVGETTITITYEGKTDAIEVTVGEFLAMEIIADLPTFTVEKETEFTVGFEANSDVGKNVLAYFTLPEEIVKFGYYEVNDVGEGTPGWVYLSDLVSEVVFGPPEGFELGDVTTKFRATFTTVGTYPTLMEVWEVTGSGERVELLGYKVITAVVVPAPTE